TTGTFTYNLTNVAVGSCSNTINPTLSATVTVNPNITPTFTQVGPYCNGQSIPSLPTTSNNSISGTWSPTTISNTASTSAVTTNYTFTPTSGPGICATTANMSITVHPNTTPLFTQLGPYCQGATPADFPTTSNNGIAGTWSPSTISTASAGTITYTFTPISTAPTTCATNTTMPITVTTLPIGAINGTISVCQNANPPSVTFTGSNSNPPYTFTYNVSGGASQTISTSASATSVTLPIATSTPGIYTYTLENISVGSCTNQVTTSNTATITVFEAPTITISDATICGGNSITLSPTVTPSGGQFTWNGPAVNNQNSSSITVNPSVSSVYSLSYSVNGCTVSQNVNVNVIQNPQAILRDTSICLGQNVTLTALPNQGVYSWSTGETTQAIVVSPTSTTQYTVSVSVGGCAASSATSTVTIRPIPTITATPNIIICNGQSTTIGTTVSAPGGTYSWTPSGTNPTLTVTPTLSNPTSQQTFNYSVVYTLNGCPSLPSSSTVTVNPKPTLAINNLVFCSGDNGTLQANPNLPNGTYNWSIGVSGLSDNQINVSHVALPSNQVTTYTYSGWYILNACSSDTIISTVTVNPIPNLTSSNSGNICSGNTLNIPLVSDVQGGTFNWIASSDNTNVVGESLTNQNTSNINNTLNNNSLVPETVIYNVTPSFGSCQGSTQQVTVTVNPLPAVQPISELICSGGSFNIAPNSALSGNFIPQNTLYTWTVSASIPNITGQNSNTTPSPTINGGPIISTSTSNTTLNYTVTPISGNCVGSNFSVAVTVTPTPSIADKSVSICSGNSPIITQVAGDIIASTTQYTWTILSDNTNITGQSNQTTPTSNFNSQVLINTTSSSQVISYTVTPNSGPCIGNPFVLTVTVNPGPSLSNATYEICSNTEISGLALGSPSDIVPIGTTFTWSVAANSNIIGENSNTTASGTFSTGILQNSTNSNQTVVYTVTPIGPSTSQPQCNGTPFQVSVIVKPTPSLPNTQLPDICGGSAMVYNPSVNTPSGAIFNSNTVLNWTVSANNSVSGQSNNSSSSQTTINQTLTNLSDSPQTLVYTVTPFDLVSTCSGTPFTVTITIHPVPNIQNQTASICTGSPFSITPANTPPSQIVPSGTTFSWTNPVSTPTNVVTGGSAQTGQTSISQILNNSTLSDATLVYTVTPTYVVSSQLTCTGNNFIVSVVVRPTPTVTATANDPVICAGSSTSLNAIGTPAVNSGNIPGTYNWTPTNQIVGSTTSSTVTAQPTTTTTYIVVYSLSGCPSQAFPITVTVQSPPEIATFTASESTICVGGCTQVTANFIGGTAVDYVQWSTGQITNSAPHTINVCPTNTTQYSATAFLLNCSGNPNTVTITVNPDPSFILEPIADTAICVGGTFPLSVEVTGGAGTPVYQWFQNTTYTNVGGTAIPNANSPTYIPNTFNTSGNYYYYCQVTYSPSGCGFITSTPARIRVVSDPQVLIIGQDETLCIGGTPSCLTAVVTGGVGSATFQWNPNIANGNLLCPLGNTIGTTGYSVAVTQTGIGCASTSINTISITVVPDPFVTISGINEVCYGAQVPLTTTVSGGIGNVTNYQWFLQNPIGSVSIPINNSNLSSYTANLFSASTLYSVNILQSGEGCNAFDDFIINVFPDPQVNLVADAYSCLGSLTTIEAVVTGGVPNSINNFTWFVVDTFGSSNPLQVQGPNTITSFSFISFSDTTVFVNVFNNGFGCNLTSDTIQIDGLLPVTASIGVSNTQASFFDPTFNFFSESTNATDFFWDLGGCIPQLPMSDLYATPTFSYNPTSQNILDYTYGCPPGVYTVQLVASNLGYCQDTTTLSIFILSDVLIYVPNTFTPDGDENNNLFYPVFNIPISPNGYVFQIFDRWGVLIFETSELPEFPTTVNNTLGAWDGKYRGKISQDGTYTWRVKYRNKINDDVKTEIGHVNLLR
ncbi:MAG: hypothetical protein RL264_2614, partial [Bacteroidota bacterium]